MIATSRTFRAISTTYAGCRFRSRLEARWAVFFDHLGITWDYEPQGHVVTDRLNICDRDEWPYLPDFWLPELRLWVEVKGSLDDREMRQALSAAADLSSPAGGCGGGHDVLILGPIPRPGPFTRSHLRLHMHKGDLKPSLAWAPEADPHYGGDTLAYDAGEIRPGCTPARLLNGDPAWLPQQISDAYAAARSARFEHGERG